MVALSVSAITYWSVALAGATSQGTTGMPFPSDATVLSANPDDLLLLQSRGPPADLGYPQLERGYYDATQRGNGTKLDYGRWVGEEEKYWSVSLFGSLSERTRRHAFEAPSKGALRKEPVGHD